MRSDLPTGTVTLVFTDIEGSTKLLREHTCRAAGLALDDTAYLVDLGEHRLTDFERSVRILQLGAERFPR